MPLFSRNVGADRVSGMTCRRWLPHAAKATRLSLQHGDPVPVRACAIALARVDNAVMRPDGGGGSHRQAGHGREQLRSHSCACGWKRDPCTPVNVAPMNAAGRRAVRRLMLSEAPFAAVGAGVKENVLSNAEGALATVVVRTPGDVLSVSPGACTARPQVRRR